MTRLSFLINLILWLCPAILVAQQSHVNIDWRPFKNTENLAPPYGTNTVSPIVHDDRTVTFRLLAPGADSVMVVGLPVASGKPVAMKKGEKGLWETTVGPLQPDIYLYKLQINGVNVPDPNNSFVGMADQPPYSTLIVHGDAPQYYDPKPVPHGAVTRHFYHSDVTKGEREIYVYTPPGYDPTKAYPVLYLVGGSGELASNWAIEGRANFIMDNLLAEGKVVPMIIAMPNNQLIHRQHPNHVDLTFNLFEADLKQHVVPFVDSHYKTIKNPGGRALAGLSMGGRHTQYIGFKNLDLFGSLGILSAGDVNTETLFADFLKDPATNSKINYLFVGQGTLEAARVENNRTLALHEALKKHNIRHEYYAGGEGAHEWKTWRHLLYAKLLPGLWRR